MVIKAKVRGCTCTVFADNTQTMCIVDHNVCTVSVCYLNYLRQFYYVAFHAENTVNSNKLNSLLRQVR